MNVDDLELELRKLPGVRAAGFTERDDVLLIQLQVSGETPPPNLPLQATRIAYRHSEKPVALEVVRWRVVAAATRPRAAGGLAARGRAREHRRASSRGPRSPRAGPSPSEPEPMSDGADGRVGRSRGHRRAHRRTTGRRDRRTGTGARSVSRATSASGCSRC